MYAFHLLARFNPEFLASDEHKERLKDFRLRLGYFAKGTQNYIKELRHSLAAAPASNDNEEVQMSQNIYQVWVNTNSTFYFNFRTKLDVLHSE